MNVYENIVNRNDKIAVIGLGYVGLPLAIAFGKRADVIGFDISAKKINQYKQGIDITNEVGHEALQETSVFFTNEELELRNAKFFIVAVPTPISAEKVPDLSPIVGASTIIGRNLTKGSTVVYESTVYPGVTEDICIPILEKESNLKCGVDFKIGYSPERINPGDKIHTIETITKIVSGIDEESLDEIAKIYELVVKGGVYKAESIKVAEAAKVVENSQRDINIAFMNELAMVFNKMGIDTNEVIKAMSTKWNALNFRPGLVGGHCIGVDPYYFIYKAEQLGYHSQIILSGRKVNDDMGYFVAQNTIKQMVLADKKIKDSKVAVFGITFKENCPDVRNSKVVDIVRNFEEYGIRVLVYDPIANKEEAKHEYSIDVVEKDELKDVDVIVLAVAHDEFKTMSVTDFSSLYTSGDQKIIVDVKSVLNKQTVCNEGFIYWNL